MKFSIIVNPNAGKKQGMAIASQTSTRLIEKGHELEILVSNKPGDTVSIAEKLNIRNLDGIIAVGGDGTLFELINGLKKNDIALDIPIGQIPVGTGNSFIKDLGITTTEQGIEAVLSGNTRLVDLGEFSYTGGTFYFINLLGAGFVSNVAYRAKKYKKLGSLSYIMGVLEEIVVLKSAKVELVIDGVNIKREAVFIEICNSRFTGGDMMMAPGALIDDGFLDVIILNKTSRIKLLSLFPSIFKGEHVEDATVEVIRGKKITLTSMPSMVLTPDGETFGKTPIDVKIHPVAVKLFC